MTSLPGKVGRLLLALLIVGATLACSPEASRQRGQPGADIGNHSPNSPQPSTAPKPSHP